MFYRPELNAHHIRFANCNRNFRLVSCNVLSCGPDAILYGVLYVLNRVRFFNRNRDFKKGRELSIKTGPDALYVL